MRVLIVDDEPQTHTAMASLLSGRPDEEAFSAASLIEALENVSRNSHEVLLLVVRMREVSGLGSTDQLKGNGRSIHSAISVGVAEKHGIAATQPINHLGNPFSNKWPDEALNQAAEGNPSQRSAKRAKLCRCGGLRKDRSPVRLGSRQKTA